jgi:hypothetical protein
MTHMKKINQEKSENPFGKTQSDIDQAILQVWGTTEDLDMLIARYMDAPEKMTEDELANALEGIKQMIELRCWHLRDVYKKYFQLDEYNWSKNV